MDKRKDVSLQQSPGQIETSASKMLSILKQPKRVPLQPIFMNPNEDDTNTTTSMSLSHQRKVSFSGGTQIKEFRNDTEGISEGWGSSYEESLKSDSTRSSESSASWSEHHGDSHLKLSMTTGRESVMSNIPGITGGPPLAVVNRQEINYQRLTNKMKMCEIKNVFHFDTTVKSVTTEIVPANNDVMFVVPNSSGAQMSAVSRDQYRTNLWPRHVESLSPESSCVNIVSKNCSSSVEQPESDEDIKLPSDVAELFLRRTSNDSSVPSAYEGKKLDKPRSCLLSPSVKYSQTVHKMIFENIDVCKEPISFEKSLGEDDMEETGTEFASFPEQLSYPLSGQNCGVENHSQSTHVDIEGDIFFPVLCNAPPVTRLEAPVQFLGPTVKGGGINVAEDNSRTTCGGGLSCSGSDDVPQDSKYWENIQTKTVITNSNKNLNCSQESVSMELTDILPASQIQVLCPEKSVTRDDCMELTEPIRTEVLGSSDDTAISHDESTGACKVVCGNQESSNSDGQCNTAANDGSQMDIELTDVIGSVPANAKTLGESILRQKNCWGHIEPYTLETPLQNYCVVYHAPHGNVTSGIDSLGMCSTVANDSSRVSTPLMDVVGNVCTQEETTLCPRDQHDSVVSSHKRQQLLGGGHSVIKVLKDKVTVLEEHDVLPLSEELQASLIQPHENIESFPNLNFLPENGNCPGKEGVTNLNTVADSSAMSNCSQARSELSLVGDGGVSAAAQPSSLLSKDKGLQLKYRSLDLCRGRADSEDFRNECGFAREKGSFKRQISDDFSSQLPRKKFLTANAAVQEDVANQIEPKVLTTETSLSSYTDGPSKHEKSSLQLESGDISSLWQSHTNQSDTNFEDNTSRLLAAEVYIDCLEQSAQSFHVQSTNVPFGSCPAKAVVKMNCRDVKGVKDLEGKVSVAAAVVTDAYKSCDCDQQSIGKEEDISWHRKSLEHDYVDGAEFQILRDAEALPPLDSKCGPNGENIDGRTLVGDERNHQSLEKSSSEKEVKGGRLTHNNVDTSLLENYFPQKTNKNITFDNEEYSTTTNKPFECSAQDNLSNNYVKFDDTEKQPQISNHRGSLAEIALRNASEFQSSNILIDDSKLVTGSVENEEIVKVCIGMQNSEEVEMRPESQTGVAVPSANLMLEASLDRGSSPHPVTVDVVSEKLLNFEGSMTDDLAEDPLKVDEKLLLRSEHSGSNIVIGSDAIKMDIESLNFQPVRNKDDNIEVETLCIVQQEQNDGSGINVNQVFAKSCDSPDRNNMETDNNENSNLSICDSSVIEDFSVGDYPDQQNLINLMKFPPNCSPGSEINDCVLISTNINEQGSFVQLALHESVNEGGKHDDCTGNDMHFDENDPGLAKSSGGMNVKETSCLIAENVSAVVILGCELAHNSTSAITPVLEKRSGIPTSAVNKMLCDAGDSPGNCKKDDDPSVHLFEAQSTSGMSISTSSTPDSRHMSTQEPDPTSRPAVSVEDFLNKHSKSEECVWTIKAMNKEEWVFQFLFTSLELILKLGLEDNEELSKYRTITDVYLNSRVTEKTDSLAHLVHHIILKKFPQSILKSLCCTTEDVPRILQLLSTEVYNMTEFMLEFDALEKTGKLSLKEKCVTIRMSDFELPSLFDVTVDLADWGNISEADVSTQIVIGSVRVEDIQRLACTVAQGPHFLSQYILAINDYLRHLTTFIK